MWSEYHPVVIKDAFIRAAVILVFIAIAVVSVGAVAAEDCKLSINKLIETTQSIAITGRNAKKDRAALVAELEIALTDLDTVKPCTAVQKLKDFKSKVNGLIAAGRININENAGATAKNLIDAADAAITCINTESAGCGT